MNITMSTKMAEAWAAFFTNLHLPQAELDDMIDRLEFYGFINEEELRFANGHNLAQNLETLEKIINEYVPTPYSLEKSNKTILNDIRTAQQDFANDNLPLRYTLSCDVQGNIDIVSALKSLQAQSLLRVKSIELLEADSSEMAILIKVDSDYSSGSNKHKQALENACVERGSYDAANGVLMLMGEPISIIKQPNKRGTKNEKNPAKLMRLLFDVNTFPGEVPIRKIFPVKTEQYTLVERRKARALVTYINECVQEKFQAEKLINCDKFKFYIEHRYLKN